MNDAIGSPDFNSLIVDHARKDFPLLDANMSVAEALDRIRREGVGERVIYFFAIDSEKRLVGVLPTRRLLTAALETRLEEIMVRRVVAIPATATVFEACEFFVLYKFFAFPVVDERRRVVGVVDVSLFAEEMLEAGDRQNARILCRLSAATIFSRHSVFVWPNFAGRRPGARFAIAFHGFWRQSAPARPVPCWLACLRQRSPAVSSSHFFSRWCLA